jgi:hypothetical protein
MKSPPATVCIFSTFATGHPLPATPQPVGVHILSDFAIPAVRCSAGSMLGFVFHGVLSATAQSKTGFYNEAADSEPTFVEP